MPKNLINKYKMLKLFRDKKPSKKIYIKPVKSNIKIDRTLATQYSNKISLIWKKSKS